MIMNNPKLHQLIEELEDLVKDMKIPNSPLTHVDEDLAEAIFDRFPIAVTLLKVTEELVATLERIADGKIRGLYNLDQRIMDAKIALESHQKLLDNSFPK